MSYRDALNASHEGTVTAGNSSPALPGNPDSKFLQIVNRHMQRGLSKAEAMRAAAGEDPEAHQEWIRGINHAPA